MSGGAEHEPGGGSALPRSFYAVDALVLAEQLLNKVLVRRGPGGLRRSGRIVEVEAYRGAEDPGSHAFRGPTRRNQVMFGPPGHLYVYFTYGMHWCANVVAAEEGRPQAVLIRALRPVEGLEAMWAARPAARRERDLLSGPAKLCQALGIDGDANGDDLVTGAQGVLVVDDGVPVPERIGRSTRIGLRDGAELPWRRFVLGDPNTSRPAVDGS